MNESGNTFLIEEAEISFTLESDNGIKVWMGGCANKLALTDEFTETALQYHGEPYEETKHVNESHKIEIENVWLLNTSMAPPVTPLIQRGQIYNLVIVWFDEETLFWNKRTYYGVLGQSQRIGDNAFQNLSFRAKRMIPETGSEADGAPDTAPAPVNQVIYVNGQQRIPLYNYDPATGAFAAANPGLIPSLAEIVTVGSDVLVKIGGVTALKSNAGETSVKELIAQGTTIVDEFPRLEFWLNSRVASLTKTGKLAAGNVSEAVPVITPTEFQFGYGGDGIHPGYASLGQNGLVAATVGEDL